VDIVWIFLKKTLTDHLRCLGYFILPFQGSKNVQSSKNLYDKPASHDLILRSEELRREDLLDDGAAEMLRRTYV
jgi:hypothetical protein